ncbi:uncharacterized protein LOC131363874 isoform X2 [Hemibagrus wyckioides]|nr:uncharacterized protein LOC131363874 isoform X2 [Hemibagrus wyckioides]
MCIIAAHPVFQIVAPQTQRKWHKRAHRTRQNWILRNLDFLRSHVQPRQGVSTLNLDEMYDSGDDQVLHNEELEESDTSESSSHDPSQPRSSTIWHKQSQRPKLREEDKLEREKVDILKQVASSVCSNTEDSDDIFGKQVASEMRLLKNTTKKIQARRAIMRVLYEAQDRFMSAQCRAQVPYPPGPPTQPTFSHFVEHSAPHQPLFQVSPYQQTPLSTSYTQLLDGRYTQGGDKNSTE